MYILILRNFAPELKGTVHNLGESFAWALLEHAQKFYNEFLTSVLWTNFNKYKEVSIIFKNQFKLNLIFCNININAIGELISQEQQLLDKLMKNNLILAYDDILLKSGNIKFKRLQLKTKHNGVIGILHALPDAKLWSIRIGATKPDNVLCRDFVLSKINEDSINQAINKACIHFLNCIIWNEPALWENIISSFIKFSSLLW